MPIAKHLRPLYKTESALAAKERAFIRADHKCERCGKPRRYKWLWIVKRGPWEHYWSLGYTARATWRDMAGEKVLLVPKPGEARRTRNTIGIAHLNNQPGDNSDANLQMLCADCHLKQDQSAHAQTRKTRKDRGRPLLVKAQELP